MSKVENVNFCYICDLAFETRKQFVKHNLNDELLSRARKEYEDEVEDKTRERVCNSDEDDYVLRPKDNTKDIIKTKTETETKDKTKSKTEDGPEAMLRHTSTPELSMSVKIVMKNLGIK